MRILFFSPCAVDPKLGAARVLLALAGALEARGCACTLLGPPDFTDDGADVPPQHPANVPARFAEYLHAHAADFDVVDFDVKYLRLRRDDFPRDVLMVARAQLLRHHHVFSPLPPRGAGLGGLFRRLKLHAERLRKRRSLPALDATFREADLVTLGNRHAKDTLVRRGVTADKILLFPNGMAEERRAAFDAVPVAPPPAPMVGFVGMFGPRKGSADFPDLVRRVVAEVPDVRFRLLGTRGLYQTADEVLALFPPELHGHLDVIPRYEPPTLPSLLAPCSVGVFPSYAEGFPLGVLEMLSAALPVFAYDAPGAPEMLPTAHLVPPSDTAAMSQKVIALLKDRQGLADARQEARAHAHTFRWESIAERTEQVYADALARLRAGASPIPPHPHTSPPRP